MGVKIKYYFCMRYINSNIGFLGKLYWLSATNIIADPIIGKS